MEWVLSCRDCFWHKADIPISHDRGARVGHRLALDHPDRLTKPVMMDICPTHYMYKTADQRFASAYFHWFFLIQAAPFPETLIENNVDAFLKLLWARSCQKFIEPVAYAEYRRCFSDPATIHATCEDYRAAAKIDLVHDEADMNRNITCPTLVLWGANGIVGRKYDVLAVWRDRASHVSGKALPSGHWLAEDGRVKASCRSFTPLTRVRSVGPKRSPQTGKCCFTNSRRFFGV
jgi:haloacetate dehalogenase